MSKIVAALRGVWEQDRGGASPLDGIEFLNGLII